MRDVTLKDERFGSGPGRELERANTMGIFCDRLKLERGIETGG